MSFSNHREWKKSESGRTAVAALADRPFRSLRLVPIQAEAFQAVVAGAKAGKSKRFLRPERLKSSVLYFLTTLRKMNMRPIVEN